jgi:hypothetical protein
MNTEIWNRFAIPLWSDVASADEYYNRKPHLAHYTSIASMEKDLAIERAHQPFFT